MFHRLWTLIRKELQSLLREPQTRAILIMPVLIQVLLFPFAATLEVTNATIAIYNEDSGRHAVELTQRFARAKAFTHVLLLQSPQAIQPTIDEQKALLVVRFPADFSRNLDNYQTAPLQLLLDGRNSNSAQIAANYLQQIVKNYQQELLEGKAKPNNSELVVRNWYNPNLESRWNLMPALIAALSLIQTLLLAALSVAREREQGTFDQLLVTPLTPMQILVGKALPAMLVGLVQSTVILLIIRFWFQIPMSGSPWLLYLGLLVFTGATVGLGLSISALSLTMQQAMLYTFLLIMPMMLLSGLLTPVSNMPEPLQIVTYANPLRFGMDLVRRVYLEGAGLREVAFDFVPMLVMAIVTLPLAAWLFRNRLS